MNDEEYYAFLDRLVGDLRDISGTFYGSDNLSSYDVSEVIEGILQRRASRIEEAKFNEAFDRWQDREHGA